MFEFTTRQIIITRVYDPARWWMGLTSHLLFNAGSFGGLALAISGLIGPVAWFALAVIFGLGKLQGISENEGRLLCASIGCRRNPAFVVDVCSALAAGPSSVSVEFPGSRELDRSRLPLIRSGPSFSQTPVQS